MSKKKDLLFLFSCILLLIGINYKFLDEGITGYITKGNYETAVVERVIDGDTIVLDNGDHVRMLGINTPEKKELYHDEAKKNLENLVLNKTVKLEFGKDKKDMYNRTLAYIYFGDENINLEQIRKGYANFYFPSGKDLHYNEFKEAWEKCISEGKNLCEKSKDKYADCIKLKELNAEEQKVIFENNCLYWCEMKNWDIKDEGRKHFVFPDFTLKPESEIEIRVAKDGTNTDKILFWKRSDYVWTKTGDTLFLRDNEGKLVLWENY